MNLLKHTLPLMIIAPLSAATISWTAGPTSITDDSDISLAGTPVYANYWGGAAAVTVGSITFDLNDTANASLTRAGQTSQAAFFDSTGTTVTAGFESVLDSFGYDGANPKVLTLNNLTMGDMYQVQLFVSDDRSCCSGRTQLFSDNAVMGAGNETATFSHLDSVYVTGVFMAGAATETIYAHGVGQTQNILNAVVVRAIPVPEPSTVLLGALGGLALLRRRRRS